VSDVSPLIRAAVIVSDLGRSRDFYRSVIGLNEVKFEGDLTRGNACRLLGVSQGTKITACILKSAGPPIGMVGLFQIGDAEVRGNIPASNCFEVGDVALVMNCTDLDVVHERAKLAGAPVICPPLRLETEHFVGVREMSFLDPDGTKINLIERPIPKIEEVST
jgi:catechol 2,3-dioxygenase-like lactoylglutathione lyase family enzyme